MQINYILIADGGVMLPSVNHSLLNAHTPAEVESETTQIIQILSKAGYTRFSMLDVRNDHKEIARYTVEHVKPVVARKAV